MAEAAAERRDKRRPVFQRSWTAGILILAVLLLASYLHEILSLMEAYRQLPRHVPPYVRGSARSVLEVLLALAAVRLLWAGSVREAVQCVGLGPRLPQGLVFGLAGAAPMLLGLALTMSVAPGAFSPQTLYLAGISPLAEEIVFRGFAVGLLFKIARVPTWAAIGLPAVVFGFLHVDFGAPAAESLGLFLLTGFGGAVFGWIFLRWGASVWFPFGLHAFMNFAWNLFDVADTALGGWYPLSLQLASVLLAILITLRLTAPIRRQDIRQPG